MCVCGAHFIDKGTHGEDLFRGCNNALLGSVYANLADDLLCMFVCISDVYRALPHDEIGSVQDISSACPLPVDS